MKKGIIYGTVLTCLTCILTLFSLSCNTVTLVDREGFLWGGGILDPENKDPVDPKDLPDCAEGIEHAPDADLCVVFHDTFEREEIVTHEIFHWSEIIMDHWNPGGTNNVDAKIENSGHLGHVIHKEKAVLFRGREGGSTHEIYLVSNISSFFDCSSFTHMFIQFRYVPLSLDGEIYLTVAKKWVPESIRVDVCNKASDTDCGITGGTEEQRLEKLVNPGIWDQNFLLPIQYGQGLNIREYDEPDWEVAKVLIDLSKYPKRNGRFAFKITAAMDEGYFDDDRNKKMEDGIVFDDIVLIAIRAR